jgi:hypothetical protein
MSPTRRLCLAPLEKKLWSLEPMSTPDPSDKDVDDEIVGLHGDTSIETMRRIYGEEFAKAFEPLNKLSDALSQTGEKCLEWVHRAALRDDHRNGSLAKKLSNMIL